MKLLRAGQIAVAAVGIGTACLLSLPEPGVIAADRVRPVPSTVPLGRANPFEPLVGGVAPPSPPVGASLPAVAPAGPPALQGAPAVVPPPPRPLAAAPAPALELLGVAYGDDGGLGSGVTAAVRVGRAVRFVHLGDQLEGGTVTSITSSQLELVGPHSRTVVRKPLASGARHP